jgi:putative ABC transport system permease protein
MLVGLVSSTLIGRAIAALLYGVGPTDPLTYGVTALFLSAVALNSSYLPARRVLSVTPAAALRQE